MSDPGNAGGSPAEASSGALRRFVAAPLNFTQLLRLTALMQVSRLRSQGLFVSQCRHRIHPGGPARGQVTGKC
jgi:hypothetical protein